jgi:hypothetical protein
MFFVQKLLRLVGLTVSPARSAKSMNRGSVGKRKFVTQFHVHPKTKAPILHTENSRIGKIDNVKTSPERQVKARHIYIALFPVFGCFLARQVSRGRMTVGFRRFKCGREKIGEPLYAYCYRHDAVGSEIVYEGRQSAR